MKYRDLQDLIKNSRSSRAYFLSLPVESQLRLHQQNRYIHTAEELHRQASADVAILRLETFGHWKSSP